MKPLTAILIIIAITALLYTSVHSEAGYVYKEISIPVTEGTCRDVNGDAVAVGVIRGLILSTGSIASSTKGEIWFDKMTLLIDPTALTLIFYHECAHQMLGHTLKNKREFNVQQITKLELDADCLAAQRFVEHHGQKKFQEALNKLRPIHERQKGREEHLISCGKT